MDHPDIDPGFRQMKKKKGKADAKKSGSSKTKASEPRNAPSQQQPQQHQQYSHPDLFRDQQVESKSMISESKGFGYSWNMRSSRSSEESGVSSGRKLSMLSSRKQKPQNLNDAPRRKEDNISHKFLTTNHPDISNLQELRIKEPIFAHPLPGSPMEQPRHAPRLEGVSQPSTPSWAQQAHHALNEPFAYHQAAPQPQPQSQVNMQAHLPAMPVQHSFQQYPPQHPQHPQQYMPPPPQQLQQPQPQPPQQPHQPTRYDQQDPSMFARTASDGNRWVPVAIDRQPALPPVPPSQNRYPGGSIERHNSASGSSTYSMAISVDSPPRPRDHQDHARQHQAITGLPKSAPDLTNARNPAANFPPGHPLARYTTRNSQSSRGSSESARGSHQDFSLPQRLEQQAAIRPMELPRQPVSPLTPESILRPVSPLDPDDDAPPAAALQHLSYPSNDPRHAQTRRLTDPHSRPVSPADDDDLPWLRRNVSALTLDTTVSPTSLGGEGNVRNSIVSAISPCEVSPIDENDLPLDDGALSPLGDENLPGYGASQQEVQRRKQRENERRAEELRRRSAFTNSPSPPDRFHHVIHIAPFTSSLMLRRGITKPLQQRPLAQHRPFTSSSRLHRPPPRAPLDSKPRPRRPLNTGTIPSSSSSSSLLSLPRRLLGSLFGPSATPEDIMAAREKAQKIIDGNGVAVFSKSYCPYCKATKELLSRTGAKYEVLELDQIDDGAAIQDALEDITKQRSVPNIFIGKKHIGGNSDIQALPPNELKEKLTSAGAL